MAARRSASQGQQPTPAVRLPGRLAKEGVPPVVVLAGSEGWFRARGVEAVVATALPDGDAGGSLVRWDARVQDQRALVAGALDELRTTSLFAPGKVVIVENPEAAPAMPGQGRKAVLTHLAHEALAHPVEGAVLVLVTGKGVKGREAVSTKSLLEKGAWVVDCRALYEAPAPWERGVAAHDHELSRFVAGRMGRVHGKRLALEDAHALTRLVGSDLGALEDALRSLALYVGDAPEVRREDIEATVGRTREDPIWKLVDAVFDGEVDAALSMTTAAFERGLHDARGAVNARPESLFPMLAAALHAAYRRVLAGAEGLARGDAPAAIAQAAGVPAFLAETHAARCRRDPARLLALHPLFLEAELGVKGGGVPARLAAERLVAGLVRGLARDVPARA